MTLSTAQASMLLLLALVGALVVLLLWAIALEPVWRRIINGVWTIGAYGIVLDAYWRRNGWHWAFQYVWACHRTVKLGPVWLFLGRRPDAPPIEQFTRPQPAPLADPNITG